MFPYYISNLSFLPFWIKAPFHCVLWGCSCLKCFLSILHSTMCHSTTQLHGISGASLYLCTPCLHLCYLCRGVSTILFVNCASEFSPIAFCVEHILRIQLQELVFFKEWHFTAISLTFLKKDCVISLSNTSHVTVWKKNAWNSKVWHGGGGGDKSQLRGGIL